MRRWDIFNKSTLDKKIETLFQSGNFVISIRYYGYKINLYQLGNDFVEVFINHKKASIEKIEKLDIRHSRMKFYCDQIKISN
jgi:hypothetical protein